MFLQERYLLKNINSDPQFVFLLSENSDIPPLSILGRKKTPFGVPGVMICCEIGNEDMSEF